jgi:hypothetical protein
VIKHEGSKWVLYTSDGSKKLSEHSSKKGAINQERAIKAHEADQAKKTK